MTSQLAKRSFHSWADQCAGWSTSRRGNRLYFSEPPGEPIPMAALGNADKNSDGVIEIEEVKKSVGASRLIERIDKGYGNNDGKVDLEEWDRAFGTFLNRGGLSCLELKRDGDSLKGSSQIHQGYTKSTPYIRRSFWSMDMFTSSTTGEFF